MKQLEFSSMGAKEDFETIIQDALLYCQTTASVGRCVLKEIKARGRSTMGAKAFVHILLSTADALEDYAQRVADGQGINAANLAFATKYNRARASIGLKPLCEQEAIAAEDFIKAQALNETGEDVA